LAGYATETWVGLNYYNSGQIDDFFSGAEAISGYNKSNWDTAYNDKINSASFNTTNGILTLTQQDTGTITVDLDGRYLTSATDSQTLSWEAGSKNLSISNGNTVTLDGLATEEFVTSQGYITSYTEIDTLQSVTSRGSSTNTDMSIGGAGGDRGLAIYHTDYGRIRFYQSTTNISTIHSFGTSWAGGDVFASGGAINITGNTGVTFGGWNIPDVVFVNGGTSYFRNNVGIGTSDFADISFGSNILKVYGSRATLGLTSSGTLATIALIPSNDPSKGIHLNHTGDGSFRWYQYSVGDETFVLAANGNLGFGATNPQFGLHVSKNQNQVAGFQSPNGNTWIDLISTAGTWSMGATSGNTWAIYERGSGNATRFEVSSSAAFVSGEKVATQDWVQSQGYLTSETDSQTLSWEAGSKNLTISNGNTVTLDGLATEEYVTSQGYITGYTETDTLASVTGRGASTSSPITINGGESQPLSLTTANGGPWHIALVRNDLGLTSRVFAHNSPYNGWYFEHNISISGNTNWHSGNDGAGSGLDADLLDGQQGSYYAQASLSNNKTYTSTGNAVGSYLGGHYSSGGGEKPNSGTFGAGKLKIAMLSNSNLGFSGPWNDVIWVSSYNGGDVKSSHALIFDKYSSNVWVSDQNYDSETWGQGYQLWHTAHFTQTNINNWNTAYGWGDHTSAGYIVQGTQILSGAEWPTATRFGSVGDISQAAGNHALSVRSEVGNDAFMSFHIGNDYAVHFGLDDVTNRLHVGGWSETGNKYQIWDSRDFTSTNISNWNTAYSWGNHAGLYLPLSGGTISGNLNVSGQLAFPDGGGNYTNIIRSAGYPSEGYPDGQNYWMEYRAFGGHHFVLNVDGGVGGGENAMDDFVIWQGAIDGDRLLELTNAGNLTIKGTFTEQSSIRFKENIKPLEPLLGKVEQLNPVTYNKIGVVEEEIGLIAEEVAELFPEVVTYNEDGQPQGVQYQRLSVILLKAVQELSNEVKELKAKLK
jgi:hypothetical protein